jgi:aminopeptidase N
VLAADALAADVEFLQAMAADPHARVRVSALRALGERRDVRLLPFFRERFARDDSYLAQAEALRAIGRTGDASSLPFLDQAAAMPSPRHVIRAAAEWAKKEVASGGDGRAH